MNDVLAPSGITKRVFDVTKSPAARGLVRTLGLPIPMPEPLARAKGPWAALPFEASSIVVGAAQGAALLPRLAAALAEAGARPWVEKAWLASFTEASEAYARPARVDDDARVDAIVFDASGVRDTSGLRALYDFFQPRVSRLKRSGRVVVLARTADEGDTPERAAVQAALSGFVRSVAKELGRKGSTANLVCVERGAEARVGPVLRWLLEARSAFVTAQPIVVSRMATDARPPRYVRPLDGQVALVTGAARGIGRATARALADEGAFVLCVDRPEDGEETSKVARAIGGLSVLLDVTAADAVATIEAALGDRKVDVIVHNAGVTRDKTLARMQPGHWDLVMAINLEAVMRITEGLTPRVRDGGRIVCVSSVSGIAGNVGQSNYAASKAAIVGYVDALAKQLASRGITANAVAPGFIETRMTSAIPIVIRQAGRMLSALGQGGEPEDVAATITFLASPGAQGVTGRTLRVCGGALIGA